MSLLAVPVMAGAYTTVQQGGTVYIGEQGLNVAAAVGTDTSIGWWASGAAIATSSPDYTYPVSSSSNFYVSPSPFEQYTGTWYRINSQGKEDGIAFTVDDPSLSIRVIDSSINLDVTNKWIPRGDQATFEIDSNLNQIFSRGSSSTEGITLYIQAPSGGQYSSLFDSSGGLHSLENLVLSSPSYQLPWSWDTGNSQYTTGTYLIWAKCDINGMYDNYGIPGKTISQQTTVLDQEQNPLISVNVPSTVSTTNSQAVQPTTFTPTTVITSTPATTPSIQYTTPSLTVTTTSQSEPTTVAQSIPVETAPTKASGFGLILAVISVFSMVVIILKKQP
ncbi:MAG: DUF3821 domain-containing protein [Methanoregula sp.]